MYIHVRVCVCLSVCLSVCLCMCVCVPVRERERERERGVEPVAADNLEVVELVLGEDPEVGRRPDLRGIANISTYGKCKQKGIQTLITQGWSTRMISILEDYVDSD